MAKIVLGKRPEIVKTTIALRLADGSEGEVKAEFAYMTKTEYADWLQKDSDAAQKELKSSTRKKDNTVADAFKFGLDSDAARIASVLKKWDVDAELNTANIRQLFDEIPGSSTAFHQAHRAAILEGRTGN